MTKQAAKRRVISLMLALLTVLALSATAFAAVVPYNDTSTKINASANAASDVYSVSVRAPSGTTQIKVNATLYRKGLLWDSEIDSMSGTSYTDRFYKSKSATIDPEQTYKVKITAEICTNGKWDTVSDEIIIKT